MERLRRVRGPKDDEWRGRRVTPTVARGLDVIFVGINPGRYSAASGHHFSGPGNHFWRLLAESGLTPVALRPEEDHRLLGFGLGVMNIVDRPSPGSDGLTTGELKRGGARLRERIDSLSPRLICLLGKEVYRHYAGLGPSIPLDWGSQPRQTVAGVDEFLAPNPSARSTIPYERRLELFRQLAALIGRGTGTRHHD